ncbi:MAG: histidine kinase [Rubrivivax sp.]|nr:histidine kinase [Rubrivivax sp.]
MPPRRSAPRPDPAEAGPSARAGRAWVWVQLLIGWLPAWAIFALLMRGVHDLGPGTAALGALRLVLSAALLGLVVQRLARRWPWPYPFRWRFMARHALAAPAYAIAWILLNSAWTSLLEGRFVVIIGPGLVPFFVTGVWLYGMVAGVSYAHGAAERIARTEAAHARAQMAALQAQLQPHFLFNALHTVMQLVRLDPPQAERALEELAALLRASLAEGRDEEPLGAQWALVQRYLAIEQRRFAERLVVAQALDPDTLLQPLPSFALQTLVENAVRHAVEPAPRPVTVRVTSGREGPRAWWVEVTDDGAAAAPAVADGTTAAGSGLARLRERLAWRHGSAAALRTEPLAGAGLRARLVLPWRDVQADAEDDGD